MKVCFIIGAMNYSGAEKVLSIIMGELADQGEDISVILLEQAYGLKETLGKIKTFGAKADGSTISRLSKRWYYIRKNVQEINPDVVVSFGSVCNVNSIMSLIGAGVPVVVCERNDPFFDPRSKKERIERNILYRLADGYVFQTEKIADYFKTICGKKPVAIIPNPIIDNEIRWNNLNYRKVISTVARLDDFQKCHYKMMKAFSLFSNKYPEYKLEIYGDGPDKERYQEYIKKYNLTDKVCLMGKTNKPQEAIMDSAAFLFTSKFEGMPNSLMEAMSIGIPCISTDCGGGGAKALFQFCNMDRYLLKEATEESIANALCDLVDNHELQLKLSLNAIKINEKLEKGSVGRQWRDYLLQVKVAK